MPTRQPSRLSRIEKADLAARQDAYRIQALGANGQFYDITSASEQAAYGMGGCELPNFEEGMIEFRRLRDAGLPTTFRLIKITTLALSTD